MKTFQCIANVNEVYYLIVVDRGLDVECLYVPIFVSLLAVGLEYVHVQAEMILFWDEAVTTTSYWFCCRKLIEISWSFCKIFSVCCTHLTSWLLLNLLPQRAGQSRKSCGCESNCFVDTPSVDPFDNFGDSFRQLFDYLLSCSLEPFLAVAVFSTTISLWSFEVNCIW